jgi:hypothetical protein
MTKQELIGLVYAGKLDSIIDQLQEAVYARKRILKDQKAAENKVALTPGTRVRLLGLRPKYLNGLEGKVVDTPARRAGDISVVLDYSPSPRFGTHTAVPAACLEGVDDD